MDADGRGLDGDEVVPVASASSSPRRYTDVLVTINSNRSATTSYEEEDLAAGWAQLLDELFTVEGQQRVWRFRPTHPGHLINVDIRESVVERGPNQRRIHAHATVSVLHTGHISLPQSAAAWKQWLDAEAIPTLSNGVYVNMQLLRESALKNYALKQDDADGGPTELEFSPPTVVVE